MDIESLKNIKKPRRKISQLLKRYGFFIMILLCTIAASIKPNLGGTNGVINSNTILWYIAIPLTYLEAGLICTPKSLYSAISHGYLLSFVIVFIYIVMPILARIGSCLLTYINVNIWLLKGMEVFFCMPPPLSVSLVLTRIANADMPTSIVTTILSHIVGFFLSPFLLYIMLGASTPPLVGVNIGEMIYSTIVPFTIGLAFQYVFLKMNCHNHLDAGWMSIGLLIITAYHWFCDAVTVDSTSVEAIDILFCVFIACIGQLMTTGLCWIFCSRWLPRQILLAALFTITHKSVGIGGWILRGAYHGSTHGVAVNLPLVILPVAQLIFGSLLACWIAPSRRVYYYSTNNFIDHHSSIDEQSKLNNLN